MKLELKNKIIKICMTTLLLILPFLDILRVTPLKNVEIFGISCVEIFNIFLVMIALFLTFLKVKKKKFKLLYTYIIIFFLYLVFHSLNILKFNANLLPLSNINVLRESFYLFRVYFLPILVLFILYQNRSIFKKEYIFKILRFIILTISLSIIILNIFKLSYATYDANNVFLKYNIFDFYKSGVDYKLLSTRGLFHSANEISAILITFLPITIFTLWKKPTKFNYFLYFIHVISMIIVGTKTSAIGALLVCSTAIFINIFMHFTRRSKIKKRFISFTILTCLYFLISPIGLYYLNYQTPNLEIENENCYIELAYLDNDIDIIANIIDNSYEYRIHEEFVKLYPIQLDVSFWKEVALRDKRINNDNRVMKIDILKRVYERNNNKYDKLFGIGYTTNFMDLERDYIYQFYLFGIIGLIVLIGPYFLILIYEVIKIFKNFKKYYSQYTLLPGMSICLSFVIAYLAGHVFGQVSPMIYLSLVIFLLIADLKEDFNENKRYRSYL